MKSVRLTLEKRYRFVNHIVGKAYKDKKEEIKRKWKKFDQKVYNAMYPKEVQEAMSNFPFAEEAFDHGNRVVVWFSGRSHYIVLDRKVPMFCTPKESRLHFSVGSSIHKEFDKLAMEQDKLDKEVYALRKKINGVLNSVRTTKQLIEVWPESEKFLIESGILKEEVKVPMVKTEELNDMLCRAIGETSPTCK